VHMGGDIIVGPVISIFVLESENVVQAFLVSKSMKWSRKTIHTSREGEIWIGKSRTNQMSGVSRNVSTFVIGVNGNIKSHQLPEFLIFES